MIVRYWGAVAALTFCMAAAAADLPDLDYQAHCEEVAEFSGGSYAIERSCLDMEVQARDALTGRETEPRIMRHCTDVAEFSGGSYSILQSCITMEEQARDSMQN